jgi:2-polyprenyl-6-methoxyphenol hydroxylase-like FAD-dependent oxidoreductase
MADHQRAIVVGASVAGLVAASVLADVVGEVVVLERDQLEPDTVERPGVPQAAHVHVLLARGYRELIRRFPDLDARLKAAGGEAVDWEHDAVVITPGGEAARRPSALRSITVSRARLESTIRALVLERPNVRLLSGHEATALIGDSNAVRGMRVRSRSSGEERAIDAWLVIDASGRSSRLPEMLGAIGFAPASESSVDAGWRYASRLYEAPAGHDWRVLYVRDRLPSGTRGGIVLRIEGGRWMVSLGGAGAADHPPTDEAGFLEFANSLISPRLHDAIADAEPLTEIRGWARMANRWRHYERMPDWPAGLAVAGDALCALDPVYGQGMSVAAVDGNVVEAWLRSRRVDAARRAGTPPRTADLVRAIAGEARLPWRMAAGEDARIPGAVTTSRPGRLTRSLSRYFDAVQLAAPRDPFVQGRFGAVIHLVSSPAVLLDPRLVGRVLASRLGRPASPSLRPARRDRAG